MKFPNGTPENLHQLTDAIEIFLVLRSFQEKRQALKLFHSGVELPFSTIVLASDQSQFEFVIDDLGSTNEQSFNFKDNGKYTLEGTLNGIHYQLIDCFCLGENHSGTGNSGQSFRFPKQIVHQQRRQIFRTAVPRSISGCVEINNQNSEKLINGRILDLSVSGMACEYYPNDNEPEKLESLEDLKDQNLLLVITIDNILQTKCYGTLKNFLPSPKQGIQRFGLAFLPLDTVTERKISKAVVEIQRATRKNQTR